jgi:hypothetical protein
MSRFMIYSWTSEIYGLGKTFRRRALFPRMLPLCFVSEHGVSTTTDFASISESGDQHSKHFVTWNAENIKRKEIYPNLSFYPQVHPWIPYRRKKRYEVSPESAGTIFFPYHSTPGYETSGLDDVASIEYLKSLPSHFQPIGVSIHMHDKGSEREKNFLKAGFGIVHHGNSLDWDYVDNFYLNLTSFRFLISESFGSQIAYAIEVGIPCHIIAREISVKSMNSDYVSSENELDSIKKTSELFRELPYEITESQKRFIEAILGLPYLNQRWSFVFLTWRLFFLNFPFWFVRIWIPKMIKLGFRKVFSKVWFRYRSL